MSSPLLIADRSRPTSTLRRCAVISIAIRAICGLRSAASITVGSNDAKSAVRSATANRCIHASMSA
jgi:hypothetical protein